MAQFRRSGLIDGPVGRKNVELLVCTLMAIIVPHSRFGLVFIFDCWMARSSVSVNLEEAV